MSARIERRNASLGGRASAGLFSHKPRHPESNPERQQRELERLREEVKERDERIAELQKQIRFWAAGFVGFIAYAALRLLGGTLFASSLRVSPLHMLCVAASLFAMSILCIRFASGKPRITQVDRASLVLAAICALLSLPLVDSYRSVAVLNVGNVALVLSWLAARASSQARQSVHNTAANA